MKATEIGGAVHPIKGPNDSQTVSICPVRSLWKFEIDFFSGEFFNAPNSFKISEYEMCC
jgi:hypothetical protein